MKTAKDLIIPFTWEKRHPILLDRFFYVPGVYEHTEKSFPFFERDLPIAIEFCSGNGQWISRKAQEFPQIHWLAVEKKFERARKIWLKSFRQNLSNLCTVCSEGLAFARYYAPKAQEVFINFPDPWPKRRHAIHRLVREEFLKALTPIVEKGGKATCVTDDLQYAGQMLKEFRKFPEWRLLFNGDAWPDYGSSFFKDLWMGAGKAIHYLSFERQ